MQVFSSYLREGQDHARAPRHRQHDFALPLGLGDPQRVEDGGLSVQADDHGDEGARVHGHQLEEHEQPAGGVPGAPLHRDVPRRVHGHHDERHQQVRRGQVHDQDPDVGLALARPARGPQHQQVADGRERAQGEGDDDAHFGRRGEGGQLERVSTRAPPAAACCALTAAVPRLLRQLLEHGPALPKGTESC